MSIVVMLSDLMIRYSPCTVMLHHAVDATSAIPSFHHVSGMQGRMSRRGIGGIEGRARGEHEGGGGRLAAMDAPPAMPAPSLQASCGIPSCA